MRGVLVATFLSAVSAACSPFNPDIDNGAFRCAAQAPRCPEGFTCAMSGTSEVCIKGALVDGPQQVDGGACIGEQPGLEPNDTLVQAYPTPVDRDRASIKYVGASICPATDVDYFRINVSAVSLLRVDVVPELITTGLVLRILNDAGAPVATGGVVSGTSTLRADIPNAAPGQYAAQVTTTDTGGLYAIEISVNP